MKSKSEFYKEIMEIQNGHISKCRELQSDLDHWESEKGSGKYNLSYILQETGRLKFEIEQEKQRAERDIANACNAYQEELQAADAMNGEDLTPDAQILLSGYPLTKTDLSAMLKRNEGNPTMTKLILKNAEDHEIDLGVRYSGYQADQRLVKQIPYVFNMAMKHYASPETVDRMIGAESETAAAFFDD